MIPDLIINPGSGSVDWCGMRYPEKLGIGKTMLADVQQGSKEYDGFLVGWCANCKRWIEAWDDIFTLHRHARFYRESTWRTGGLKHRHHFYDVRIALK